MNNSELATVLTEIVDLLAGTGYPDKAQWLKDRLALLGDPSATADSQEHARSELHGIVLGMGGLMDLRLEPSERSSLTAGAARERLDSLADRLYVLTK